MIPRQADLLAAGWNRNVWFGHDGIKLECWRPLPPGTQQEPKAYRFTFKVPGLKEAVGRMDTMKVAQAGEAVEEGDLVMVAAERHADGAWKELGRVAAPADEAAKKRVGDLGVIGDGLDLAILRVRMDALCGASMQAGVAKYLLDAHVASIAAAKAANTAMLTPARLFEDHVDNSNRRVIDAREKLVKSLHEALLDRRKEYDAKVAEVVAEHVKKAAEAEATIASFKASAEKATAERAHQVNKARVSEATATAAWRDQKRRADDLSGALRRANAKLRELRKIKR